MARIEGVREDVARRGGLRRVEECFRGFGETRERPHERPQGTADNVGAPGVDVRRAKVQASARRRAGRRTVKGRNEWIPVLALEDTRSEEEEDATVVVDESVQTREKLNQRPTGRPKSIFSLYLPSSLPRLPPISTQTHDAPSLSHTLKRPVYRPTLSQAPPSIAPTICAQRHLNGALRFASPVPLVLLIRVLSPSAVHMGLELSHTNSAQVPSILACT
ncbi:hypothetical protein BDN70DRAFT_999030 [Pholiota conissans]|uniref:Uncharacterized protein n=1 Tax=Pholiota conissans TaxID=109636 RepID=A0A9P5YK57_9AGAR|nr:hypothetical protein BDN70DRAFT_999030 [Pholiota conissans]